MSYCSFCGKKEEYLSLHKCKYCGLLVCSEHILPESHECKGINKDFFTKLINEEKPKEYPFVDLPPICHICGERGTEIGFEKTKNGFDKNNIQYKCKNNHKFFKRKT